MSEIKPYTVGELLHGFFTRDGELTKNEKKAEKIFKDDGEIEIVELLALLNDEVARDAFSEESEGGILNMEVLEGLMTNLPVEKEDEAGALFYVLWCKIEEEKPLPFRYQLEVPQDSNWMDDYWKVMGILNDDYLEELAVLRPGEPFRISPMFGGVDDEFGPGITRSIYNAIMDCIDFIESSSVNKDAVLDWIDSQSVMSDVTTEVAGLRARLSL